MREHRRTPRGTDADGLLLAGFAPGARIGEYIVEARLATRGNGQVYTGIHVVLPRRVTIKVMPAAHEWSKEVALELLREACIVDALDHPGIPRVYECGMLPDRRPWIVSELVEGPSLGALMDRCPVTVLDCAAIVRDVATVLEYAHGRGLVHCNVTPNAIIIPDTQRRFPLALVDWVGARAHDSSAPLPMLPALDRPYTAPELRLGEPFDGRADVYALGVLTRELLRRAPAGTAPPVFTALAHRMMSTDVTKRPSAAEIRDHAMWLADQIEPELGIPEAIDDDRTDPMPPLTRVITSETSSNASGEIIQK